MEHRNKRNKKMLMESIKKKYQGGLRECADGARAGADQG
jgi:hypothetical protein